MNDKQATLARLRADEQEVKRRIDEDRKLLREIQRLIRKLGKGK